MRVLAGTSGFSYDEWKGTFYPEKLPGSRMLGYYAERLPAVEINNTFYRMPGANVLDSWAGQVPEQFRFAVKASRRITHIKRLKDAAEETAYFIDRVDRLGEKLGATLFQLPPYFRKDRERLASFLALLPERAPAAIEFRHASWFEDDVLDTLRDHNVALCIADADEGDEATPVATASWGYLRLRRAAYGERELDAWLEKARALRWEHAYAFFKHEDAGAGPELAARFMSRAASKASTGG